MTNDGGSLMDSCDEDKTQDTPTFSSGETEPKGGWNAGETLEGADKEASIVIQTIPVKSSRVHKKR